MKQVIAVRTDLKMGKGKIAAQVGHACVLGAERVRRSNPDWHNAWMVHQAKVVVKVASLSELDGIIAAARDAGLPWSKVTDAGRTQLESGTVTCAAIGPAPDEQIDRITGGLKLL